MISNSSCRDPPCADLDWSKLISVLKEKLVGEQDALKEAEIKELLSRYKSKREDYNKYVFIEEQGYTKNLVHESGDSYNIIIMCWKPGQQSTFHGHEGAKCYVKILEGRVLERKVSYPGRTSDSLNSQTILRENEVTSIHDDEAIHQVVNPSDDSIAVTLHIYRPAYKFCRIFDGKHEKDLSTRESRRINVIFDSKQGELCKAESSP